MESVSQSMPPVLSWLCRAPQNSMSICFLGERVILLTLWDGTQQSSCCSQFQTPPTQVGFKPTTLVLCERLQNLLSTCRAIQSSHISAHANACFEHGFVGSTASSVFRVRAEISGCMTERIFYCSWQLRSSGSWTRRDGKKGSSPTDCTTKNVHSVLYVFKMK